MYTRRPLILCYHAVSSSWRTSLAVSETLLDSHLARLAGRGYVGLTLAEAERRRRSDDLPRRAVVVTFDDGYASTLQAQPVLARYGYPGTVFVVTSFIDSGVPLSWPGVEHWATGAARTEMTPLSWDELRSLRSGGWEVGSHTITHPRLPDLDEESLRHELASSRQAIATRLGACETIAYPYGLADRRVADAARDAGYLAAVTLTPAHTLDEPFLRPRVGLYPTDTGLRGRAKLSPASLALRATPLAEVAQRVRTSLGTRSGAGYREFE